MTACSIRRYLILKKLYNKLPSRLRRILDITEVRYVLWALLTVIFAEMLASGFVRGVVYPFVRPLHFLSAFAIVLTTYTFSLMFKKRFGVFLLIEGVWLGIAVANCILLSYRVNPLSAVDFSILFSVISIINVYLSLFQMILIGIAIAGAVGLIVYCFVRLPARKPDLKRVFAVTLSTIVLCIGAVAASIAVHSEDMKALKLPEAYEEYGFIYCFSLSTADRGIDKPNEYSENTIGDILDKIDDNIPGDENTDDLPNIIMVQLESFMDTEEIVGLTTTIDPIPNFRKLKDGFPSGHLTVPVVGAGTVNTEFEVLCGMTIASFGLGEYPYETILREMPVESMAYYLTESGYTSHAMHNHTGTFYNRYTVMEKLGFDTFTPVEYMSGVRRNSLGWAKDSILTDEITGAMESTDGADFVYAISVQPHGKYVTDEGDYGEIKVSGSFEPETLNGLEYYVNQLNETDGFVGDLISEVSLSGEKTVIVFFGDHQPSLDLTEADIATGSIYTTEYVIWNNFGLEGEDCDLKTYGLTSHLLDMLGIEGGVISEFHSKMHAEEDYYTLLSELSYDILFGEKYAYGGEFPYEEHDITYGWHSISCDGAYIRNDTLYIMGEGFTEASVAIVDGRERETIFINESLIVCADIKAAETMFVAQMSENGVEFGRAECPVISEPEE